MVKTPKQTPEQRFKNPLLEKLTLSSPRTTLVFYSLMIVALLAINFRYGWVMSAWVGIGLYFAGLFSWSLSEYFLHRYIFHMGEESDSKFWKSFHHIMHGYHHDHPKDEAHIFMPPVGGILFALFFLGLFYLVMSTNAFVFTAGFVNGYLVYTFVHFLIHTAKPPKRFKGLWQHHALHHFKYNERAFGVTSPLWDYIFGTMPPGKKRG